MPEDVSFVMYQFFVISTLNGGGGGGGVNRRRSVEKFQYKKVDEIYFTFRNVYMKIV